MILKTNPIRNKKAIPLYNDLREARIILPEDHPYYTELKIPQLPEWTDKIKICQGHQVNLFKLTCTCEDFKSREDKFKDRDVRLCCKHIYYKLTDSAAAKCINSFYKNITYASAFLNIELFFTFNIDRRDIYYGLREASKWVQVFAPTRNNDPDSYSRFSYNTELHRWSYGMEPKNAWKVEHILRSIIKDIY